MAALKLDPDASPWAHIDAGGLMFGALAISRDGGWTWEDGKEQVLCLELREPEVAK